MTAAAPAARIQRRLLPHPRMPAWAWILLLGLCVAASLPVLQSSNAAETGSRLIALEAERDRLHSERRALAAYVGRLASLSRIEQHARGRLRMVDAPPTVTLEVEHAPPPRVMPSRFLPASERVLDREAPRWQALLDLLIAN